MKRQGRREHVVLEEKTKRGTLLNRLTMTEDFDGTCVMARLDVTCRDEALQVWLDEADLFRLEKVLRSILAGRLRHYLDVVDKSFDVREIGEIHTEAEGHV